jgi:hypothetical protein
VAAAFVAVAAMLAPKITAAADVYNAALVVA